MDATVKSLINDQIGHEFYAAYLYLAMSAHFETHGYGGFAKWFRMQSREESGHAMRLFDYLVERGEEIELRHIDQPAKGFGTPQEAFRAALDHERRVTAQINRLYEAARYADDYPTLIMLQWFIQEQVEEEQSTGRAVEQLDMAGENRAALLMLDTRFGERSAEEG
ncbi:MAG TPA: ferritin [Longimicrobiales bacterium]|nr:ferritin [Longimicrobiales bacterium]